MGGTYVPYLIKHAIIVDIRLYKVIYTTYKKERELEEGKTFLENECLQLKTKLSKIEQMNWWNRIMFIFKGWKYDNSTQ